MRICRAKIKPHNDKLLLPYQEKWVRDGSRLKIAEKSRQIGWTWATAYSLVRRKCRRGERLDAWVSSRDEMQARLFLEDCRAFAKILNVAAGDFNCEVIIDKRGNAYTLGFANGRRIHSLSSNPDAQAGKRGDRVLDEFALNPDPRRLYAIAYPGITWGGSLEIFSTHRGGENFFNQLIQEIKYKGNPKGFSLHSVSLEEALKQGFLYKLQQRLPPDDPRQQMDEGDYFNFIKSGCPDEETFLQEYCCVPCDDRNDFLGFALIDSCKYQANEKWKMQSADFRNENTELYIGVDVGREHDNTVIWVLEYCGDVFYTRNVDVLKQVSFAEQEEILYEWLRLPQTRRCCIDRNGVGLQFTERAKRQFGAYRVEGVHFTAQIKEHLAYALKVVFETRRIRIPDERAIVSDLRSLKRTVSVAGNMRFDAERNEHGHADRFWALALAIHARKDIQAPTIHIV
ncbi:MAG: terminase family protein [Verrucomicrobiae bacterium]|nr:terminase family protein [Verrucomicrobiae bacterium]